MSSSELLPCPFCGGEAALENLIIEAVVYCTSCFVRTKAGHGPTEDTGIAKAIERWNARLSTIPNVDELVEAVVALADGADKCAEAPHFIVQPFLGIYKKHGETIANARAALNQEKDARG